jgi:hypothetical protein
MLRRVMPALPAVMRAQTVAPASAWAVSPVAATVVRAVMLRRVSPRAVEATAVIKVVTAAATAVALAVALAASQVQVQAADTAALPPPTAPEGL